MSLYKRNNHWWVNLSHNGRRIRQSTGTCDKKAAQQIHDELKAQLWRGRYLDEKPEYSWKDAVVRWLSESTHKRSLVNDKMNLKWLNPYLGDKRLREITREVVDHITQEKLKENVKPSTVNRLLEVVRAILRKAERE